MGRFTSLFWIQSSKNGAARSIKWWRMSRKKTLNSYESLSTSGNVRDNYGFEKGTNQSHSYSSGMPYRHNQNRVSISRNNVIIARYIATCHSTGTARFRHSASRYFTQTHHLCVSGRCFILLNLCMDTCLHLSLCLYSLITCPSSFWVFCRAAPRWPYWMEWVRKSSAPKV